MDAGTSQREVAIACRGLVKRYEDLVAVAGIDLAVLRGECFGLLGPNGAGKTTTVEILEGLKEPTAGEVEVLGRRWGAGDDRKLRRRLGVQLQETHLPDKLTVGEIVRLFASFHERSASPAAVVDLVGLGEKVAARVEKLSGGQKQRLSLACALVGRPEVLFLDEPTTGLDPQARLKVWEIVEGFRAEGGTVVLTTHYMEEAARLCDRLAIIDHGSLIAEGTPRELVDSLGAEQIVEVEVSRQGALDGATLGDLPGVGGVTARDGAFVLTVRDVGATLPALLTLAEERGTRLSRLATHQATLEDVFVHLTGRELRGD